MWIRIWTLINNLQYKVTADQEYPHQKDSCSPASGSKLSPVKKWTLFQSFQNQVTLDQQCLDQCEIDDQQFWDQITRSHQITNLKSGLLVINALLPNWPLIKIAQSKVTIAQFDRQCPVECEIWAAVSRTKWSLITRVENKVGSQ